MNSKRPAKDTYDLTTTQAISRALTGGTSGRDEEPGFTYAYECFPDPWYDHRWKDKRKRCRILSRSRAQGIEHGSSKCKRYFSSVSPTGSKVVVKHA